MGGEIRKIYIPREPLNAVTIDAFKKAMDTLPSQEDRCRAAAMLYRYHDPAGLEYLKRQLKSNLDLTSAVVLATAQDADSLKLIFQALRKRDKEDHPFCCLIYALAQWKDPLVRSGLLSVFKKHPHNPHLAVAVAAHGERSAIPQIEQSYFKSHEGFDKACFALALVHLKAANSGKMLSDIAAAIISRNPTREYPNSYAMQDAFRVASILKQKDLVPFLMKLIETYAQRPQRHTGQNRGEQQTVELLVPAVEALAQIGVAEARVLASDFLLRIAKVKRENLHVPGSVQDRTARALLVLGGLEAEPAIKTVMGEAWLHNAKAVQLLRPLPPHLLVFHEGFEPVFKLELV